MAYLGDDGVGGAGYDGVVFDLLLVGGAEDSASVGGGGVAGGQDSPSGGEARKSEQGGVGCSLVAGEEGVAGALDEFSANFVGEFFGFVNVDFPEVAYVLGAGFVAEFGGGVVVLSEGFLGGAELGGEHYVGYAVGGGPYEGVSAHDAGEPNRGVGFW